MIGYKTTDNSVKGFFLGKIIICIFLMSALLLWFGTQNDLCAKSPVRVGILPFQVFSGEKVEYLKDVISINLPQHLKTKEGLTFVDQGEIKNVTGINGIFSLPDLYRIAERTGAQFLIYGSLTKIEDNLSIDVRVFTNLEDSSPYKNFVEGKDLDLLLKNLGGKISNQISKVVLSSAPPTPTPETPQEVTPSPGTEIAQDKVSPPTPVMEETPLVEATGIPIPPEKEIEPSRPEQLETPPLEPTSGASAEAPSQPSKKASATKTSLLKPKALSSDQPVNITSDRMVADNRNRTVNFLGNVVAKREDMIIFSDQISAVYTEDGKIEKIISRGNVKINQTDRTATCQEATFFQLRQQIVMTGKPKVWQGKNIITGDKIIIFVKEDRVEVESDKQGGGKQGRVNAIIYPEGKGLKK